MEFRRKSLRVRYIIRLDFLHTQYPMRADPIQALYSVFKGRVVDPLHERDTSIEKCEVVIEDGAGEAKSRFIIKMVCKHGKSVPHCC
jgi:hypothetical protein